MKYALVTGGSRGLGKAVCIKLAGMGYPVLINYKSNSEAAQETKRLIEEAGGQAELLPFDVSVQEEVEKQLNQLPRKEIAEKALQNSRLVVVKDMEEAIEMTNEYAPEHLILSNADYKEVAERITHAGSVFMGQYSCESAGDYASGTNHTLPTKGYAKAYSGLCLDSFVRKMTFQELTAEGIRNIGAAVEIMAANEQLDAHKNAMTVRLKTV